MSADVKTPLRWPHRVWFRTDNGKWASREPDVEDLIRRKAVEDAWPKCPEDLRYEAA